MPVVVNVRFRYSDEDCWAEVANNEIHRGDHALVETQKGKDLALVLSEPEDIKESELPEEIAVVKRVACDSDFEHVKDLGKRGKDAMDTFRSYVQKNEIDMNPIAIHFLFDGSRGVFYFTAKERVDFRALVHDLASYFHMRIDMRQVGIRDEARILGGFGLCGEELCCWRMAGKLEPVSIRMAKEQDLSLNPTKISGLCGRLMCCLHYEVQAYEDFKKRAPQKNDLIDTPMGIGKVIDYNTPCETVTLRMEDGSQLVVPLKEMDTGDCSKKKDKNARPCHISQEAFDRINEELHRDKTLSMMSKRLFNTNPGLVDYETGTKQGQRGSSAAKADGATGISSLGSGFDDGVKKDSVSWDDKRANDKNSESKKKKRKNKRNKKENGKRDNGEDIASIQENQQKTRFTKRRHRVLSSQESADNEQSAREQCSGKTNTHVRPGQHSSGISGDNAQRKNNGHRTNDTYSAHSSKKSSSVSESSDFDSNNGYSKSKGRKPRRRRRLN